MSFLYKNLRIHQVFGANTDVGKTVLTSALVRSSALRNNAVFYLKPVSTGPPQDADDEHVKLYAGRRKDLVSTQCLYRFGEPVSPHLAIQKAQQGGEETPSAPSDATFVNAIASYIRRSSSFLSSQMGHMYIETAGGVHSPTLSGTTQVDAYRPLFLPTILIGDSKLGGISSTISSYEALMLRGYIVDAIVLFREHYYRNFEYLASYFAERDVRVLGIEAPPPRKEDVMENYALTEEFYARVASDSLEGDIYDLVDHLDDCHFRRIQMLDSMPSRTLSSIWWPFVQHGLVKNESDVTVIDSAWSDFFSVYDKSPGAASPETKSLGEPKSLLEPQFDGSASWWTQAFGHAHPSLTMAAAKAAGRYGHVMFPQATHLPALTLAERLLNGPGKGWASKAFFSDDGSTGMEIALKMALRSYTTRMGSGLDASAKKALGVIGLKGSYHGDTIGAMDACEEGVYTSEWHRAKGYWFDPPTIGLQDGEVTIALPPTMATSLEVPVATIQSLSQLYDVQRRMDSSLADVYRLHITQTLQAIQSGGQKLAALVLEPILMGAGGMLFVDPLFQRVMIDVVRDPTLFPALQGQSGLPVIFDEVFVGLYRIGIESSGPLLGMNPDISVHAKILTGGLVPMAVTLASETIFQAFLSENKTDALLHGHSYTAHPLGCEVANATLDLLDKAVESGPCKEAKDTWLAGGSDSSGCAMWSFWTPDFLELVSRLDTVQEVMALGTVLAIKFKVGEAGYGSHSAQSILQSIRATIPDDQLISSAPGGAPFGIHFRTLGNVAYFMTSLNTSRGTVESVENRIWNALTS